jgi:uncharacterized protein YkwD
MARFRHRTSDPLEESAVTRRARRPRRLALALLLLCALAALTGCSTQAAATGVWADRAPSAAASGSGAPGDPSASSSADPSASASGAQSATPGRTPTAAPTTGAPKPGYATAAQAVLDQTNAWRRAAGLRPYTMLSGLVASAHQHNLVMAGGCGLSHQCPGEAAFGDRIRAQGVRWMAAGENIACTSFVANNVTAITDSAKGLNLSMYNEKPPDDGHRRNLLSSTFTHIGIDVYRDGKGRLWLTEDFTN